MRTLYYGPAPGTTDEAWWAPGPNSDTPIPWPTTPFGEDRDCLSALLPRNSGSFAPGAAALHWRSDWTCLAVWGSPMSLLRLFLVQERQASFAEVLDQTRRRFAPSLREAGQISLLRAALLVVHPHRAACDYRSADNTTNQGGPLCPPSTT